MKKKKRIHTNYFILWILFCFIIAVIPFPFSSQQFSLLGLRLLIATNSATFLLYGIDKLQAITKRTRVPEQILFLTAFLGGSIGAIFAMALFRHKIAKTSFQLILALLVLLQLIILLSPKFVTLS